MKRFLYVFLFSLMFTAVYAQEEQKPLSATLDTLIKIENPNAYQKEQLLKFFNETVEAAQVEENYTGILELINQELPASAIRSFSLKDAFPEVKGKDPKGFFDSYNRAFLAYSVFEAIGRNKGAYIVDFTNQALLAFEKENTNDIEIVYIQPDEPTGTYRPTQEELNRANVLYTQEDIKSLILTRMAQQKIKDWDKELSNKEPDINILKQAETLLKQAIKLNPRNATAINEMKNLVNIMPEFIYNENVDIANKKKLEIITNYDILLLALKVANFNNGYRAKNLDDFVCNNTPYCPKKSKAKNPIPFIKATQESEDIKNYTTDIMLALYSTDLYKQMIYLGNEFEKIKGIDNIDNIYDFYFQMAMANAMVRNYKNFKKFKDLFDKKCPADTDDGINLRNRLKNVATAMEIVAGRKTAETIANEYNSGLGTRVHYFIATGHINESAFESTLVLKGWPGYTHFKNQVQYLID